MSLQASGPCRRGTWAILLICQLQVRWENYRENYCGNTENMRRRYNNRVKNYNESQRHEHPTQPRQVGRAVCRLNVIGWKNQDYRIRWAKNDHLIEDMNHLGQDNEWSLVQEHGCEHLQDSYILWLVHIDRKVICGFERLIQICFWVVCWIWFGNIITTSTPNPPTPWPRAC